VETEGKRAELRAGDGKIRNRVSNSRTGPMALFHGRSDSSRGDHSRAAWLVLPARPSPGATAQHEQEITLGARLRS